MAIFDVDKDLRKFANDKKKTLIKKGLSPESTPIRSESSIHPYDVDGTTLYLPFKYGTQLTNTSLSTSSFVDGVLRDVLGNDTFNKISSSYLGDDRVELLNRYYLSLYYKDWDNTGLENSVLGFSTKGLQDLYAKGYKTPAQIELEVENKYRELSETNAALRAFGAPDEAMAFSTHKSKDEFRAEILKKNNTIRRAVEQEERKGLEDPYETENFKDNYLFQYEENPSKVMNEIDSLFKEVSPIYRTHDDDHSIDDYWDVDLNGGDFDDSKKIELASRYKSIALKDPLQANIFLNDYLLDMANQNANWFAETSAKGSKHLITLGTANAMLGFNWMAAALGYVGDYVTTLAETGSTSEAVKYAGSEFARYEMGMNSSWTPEKELEDLANALQELRNSEDYLTSDFQTKAKLELLVAYDVHQKYKRFDKRADPEYWEKVMNYNTFDEDIIRRIETELNGYSLYNYQNNSLETGTRAKILEGQDMAAQLLAQMAIDIAITKGAGTVLGSTIHTGAAAFTAAKNGMQFGRAWEASARVFNATKAGKAFNEVFKPLFSAVIPTSTVSGGYAIGLFLENLQRLTNLAQAALNENIKLDLTLKAQSEEGQAAIRNKALELKELLIAKANVEYGEGNYNVPDDEVFLQQALEWYMTESPYVAETQYKWENSDAYKLLLDNAASSAGAAAMWDGVWEGVKYAPVMATSRSLIFSKATLASMRLMRLKLAYNLFYKPFGQGKLGYLKGTPGLFTQAGVSLWLGPVTKTISGVAIGGGFSNYTDELVSSASLVFGNNVMRNFIQEDLNNVDPTLDNFNTLVALYDAFLRGMEWGIKGEDYLLYYNLAIADRAVQRSSMDAFLIGAIGSAWNFNFNPRNSRLVRKLIGKSPTLHKFLYGTENNPYTGAKRFNAKTGLYEGENIDPNTGESTKRSNKLASALKWTTTNLVGGADALFANGAASIYRQAQGESNVAKIKLAGFNRIANKYLDEDSKDVAGMVMNIARMDDNEPLFKEDHEYAAGVQLVAFLEGAKELVGEANYTAFSAYAKQMDDLAELLARDTSKMTEEEKAEYDAKVDLIIAESKSMQDEINLLLKDKGIKAPVKGDMTLALFELAQQKYEEEREQAAQEVLLYYKEHLLNYSQRKEEIKLMRQEVEEEFGDYLSEEEKNRRVYRKLVLGKLEARMIELAKAAGYDVNSIEDIYEQTPGALSETTSEKYIDKDIERAKKALEEEKAKYKLDKEAWDKIQKAINKGKRTVEKLNVRDFRDKDGRLVGEADLEILVEGALNERLIGYANQNLRMSEATLEKAQERLDALLARKQLFDEINLRSKEGEGSRDAIIQRELEKASLKDLFRISENLALDAKAYGKDRKYYEKALLKVWEKIINSDILDTDSLYFVNRKKGDEIRRALGKALNGQHTAAQLKAALNKVLSYMKLTLDNLKMYRDKNSKEEQTFRDFGEDMLALHLMRSQLLAEEYPLIRRHLAELNSREEGFIYLFNKLYSDPVLARTWGEIKAELDYDIKLHGDEDLKVYLETQKILTAILNKLANVYLIARAGNYAIDEDSQHALQLYMFTLLSRGKAPNLEVVDILNEEDGTTTSELKAAEELDLEGFNKMGVKDLLSNLLEIEERDKDLSGKYTEEERKKATAFKLSLTELNNSINNTLVDESIFYSDPNSAVRGTSSILQTLLEDLVEILEDRALGEPKVESAPQLTTITSGETTLQTTVVKKPQKREEINVEDILDEHREEALNLIDEVHLKTSNRTAAEVANWLLNKVRNVLLETNQVSLADLNKAEEELSDYIRENILEDSTLKDRYSLWLKKANEILYNYLPKANKSKHSVAITSRVIERRREAAEKYNKTLVEGRNLELGNSVDLVTSPNANTLVSYGMHYLSLYTLPEYTDSLDPAVQEALKIYLKYKLHKGDLALKDLKEGEEIFFVYDTTDLDSNGDGEIWMATKSDRGDIAINGEHYLIVGLLSKRLGTAENSKTKDNRIYRALYEKVKALADKNTSKYSLIRETNGKVLSAPVKQLYTARNTSLLHNGRDVTRSIQEVLRTEGLIDHKQKVVLALLNGTWTESSYSGGNVKMLTFNGRTLAVKEINELTDKEGNVLTSNDALYGFNRTFTRAIDTISNLLKDNIVGGKFKESFVAESLIEKLSNSFYPSKNAEIEAVLLEDKDVGGNYISIRVLNEEVSRIFPNAEDTKTLAEELLHDLIFNEDGTFKKVGASFLLHPLVSYATLASEIEDVGERSAKVAELLRVIEDDLLTTTSLHLLPQVGGFSLDLTDSNIPKVDEDIVLKPSNDVMDPSNSARENVSTVNAALNNFAQTIRTKVSNALNTIQESITAVSLRLKDAEELGVKDYTNATTLSHKGKAATPSSKLTAGGFVGNLIDTFFRFVSGQSLSATEDITLNLRLQEIDTEALKWGEEFVAEDKRLEKVLEEKLKRRNTLYQVILSSVRLQAADALGAEISSVNMPYESLLLDFTSTLNAYYPQTGQEIGLRPAIFGDEIRLLHKIPVMRDGRQIGELDYVGILDMLAFDANGDAYIIDFKNFKVGTTQEDLSDANKVSKALSFDDTYNNGKVDDWIRLLNLYHRALKALLGDSINIKGAFILPVKTAYDLAPNSSYPNTVYAEVLKDPVTAILKDGTSISFGFGTNLLDTSSTSHVDYVEFSELNAELQKIVKFFEGESEVTPLRPTTPITTGNRGPRGRGYGGRILQLRRGGNNLSGDTSAKAGNEDTKVMTEEERQRTKECNG